MDPRPKSLVSPFHELAFCITIFFAQLLTQAGLGDVIPILHIIAPSLSVPSTPAGTAQLPWFAAAYSLTVGSFILITGRLGDVYGHKRLFVLGFAWFALCSLVLGFAPYTRSVVFFDILRAAQGIGPAAVLPNGVALLARTYPNGPRKTMVFAMFGACAPSGYLVGAAFAGIFAQLAWWPWAMWAMAITCAVVALLAEYVVVPDEVAPPVNSGGKIDWLGAALAVSGIVLFIYAWNEAPVKGWDEPYVYVLLVVGLALVALFFVVEGYVDAPIMPLDIWTEPGFPGVIACVALGWSSFGIWNFYSVQLMEVFREATPLLVTAEFSPVAVAGLVATLTMAYLHSRVRGQFILALALAAFCLGNVLIAICPVSSSYWEYIFVSMVVAPFGMDMSYPAASLIVSDALPASRQGVGASMINTVVNLSVSFGLGIAGTVESQVNDGGADALRGQRGASYVGIGLSGLGIAVALLLCRVPSNTAKGKEEETPKEKEDERDKVRAPSPTVDTNAACEQGGVQVQLTNGQPHDFSSAPAHIITPMTPEQVPSRAEDADEEDSSICTA